MALKEKLAPPPPPPPPPPPSSPPPPPPPPLPPPRSIPLHPTQLQDEGEGAILEAGEKAAALWSSGSESPQPPPHGKLPESGSRHEGGASSSRNMESPLVPLAADPRREEPAGQQGGSPQLLLCEAHELLQDATSVGVGVIAGEPPALTFGQEKNMQGHERWLPRRRSTTPSSSSSEEACTPKKARKKVKPEPATVKTEPCHEKLPLPFPMVQGAMSSRHGPSPMRAEDPEVTIVPSVTARVVIVIDDDSDDGENAMNIAGGGGSDGNTNPAFAVVAAPVLAMPRAGAPAASIEVIVIDDDSSDDEKVVNGNNAAAVLPLPMPRAPAAPIAAHTVKGNNAIREAGADSSSGGSRSGSDKAIAIGDQSKRGSGNTYSCAVCDETFDHPQALGGHTNRHRSRDKKSMVMSGLQSAASTAIESGKCVFPSGEALGWPRKRVHFAGTVMSNGSNAGSSSTPRPAAAEVPSEATAMMNHNANVNASATHGPADVVRCRSFPAPAESDAILALLTLSPVARRMAMAGNPVAAGLVSAATAAATGSWSLPAATSSVVPVVPLQSQVVNPGENVAAPGNPSSRGIRIFGVDHFPAFSSQNQEENPPQAAGEQRSIRLFGSDVSPASPSQNQEGNGPRTIRVFGVDMAEGPKEPKK